MAQGAFFLMLSYDWITAGRILWIAMLWHNWLIRLMHKLVGVQVFLLKCSLSISWKVLDTPEKKKLLKHKESVQIITKHP